MRFHFHFHVQGAERVESGAELGWEEGAREVSQLVESLREELKRPEEEIKGKFTVQTRVNRVLMCLALSGHERTDFLRDRAFFDGSLGSDEAC